MKHWLTVLLCLSPLLARAEVADLLKGQLDIHRETLNGESYVVLTATPNSAATILGNACYVLNASRITIIPETKTDLVALMQTAARNLNKDELALCSHNPVWVVATDLRYCDPAQTDKCTRPLKEIDSASGQMTQTQIGRVPVGTPCGAKIGDSIGGNTNRDVSYNGLSGYAVCELK